MAEISSVTKVKVKGAGPEDVDGESTGAVPLVLYGHMDQFAERIKPETDLLVLHSASVVESLQDRRSLRAESLVAIVSRWPEFLKWAQDDVGGGGAGCGCVEFP